MAEIAEYEAAKARGLTREVKPRDPRQVKEGGSPKKESRLKPKRESESLPQDSLEILRELAAPKAPPKEIVKLEKYLLTARRVLPEQKQTFVERVNAIVHRVNYCFQLAPDGAISLKLYVNTDTRAEGDIQFRLTSGKSRGFLATKFTLIPYVRTYGGKPVR